MNDKVTSWPELLEALNVERFGTPTPEWHPTPAEQRDADALRLIVDNTDEQAS